MGIEGGSNSNEVQSQEIQQANLEQQAQSQEAHQRSGEELEANSTIDNEGERKQIEGKDDATEDVDNSSSKLEEKNSIEGDSSNNEAQDAEAAHTEQSALDMQNTIEDDSSIGVDKKVEAEEQQNSSLENNSKIEDETLEGLEDNSKNSETKSEVAEDTENNSENEETEAESEEKIEADNENSDVKEKTIEDSENTETEAASEENVETDIENVESKGEPVENTENASENVEIEAELEENVEADNENVESKGELVEDTENASENVGIEAELEENVEADTENMESKEESETDRENTEAATKLENENSDASTDNAEFNSDVNKKPEKLKDLSWNQVNDMLKTPEGREELNQMNADFRERYEADMWGMTQKEYQDYKAACEKYAKEQEAKEKEGNVEPHEPTKVQKDADQILDKFSEMDSRSSEKFAQGVENQELKDISDSNSRFITELKDVRQDVVAEKDATWNDIAKMNYDGTKESSPSKYQELCDKYSNLEKQEERLDYAIVKMDMNNWDIAQATGIEYRNEAKSLDKSEVSGTFEEAEKVLKEGVSDNVSIMDAYRLGEKLEHDVLPSLDGERREVVSSLTMAAGYRDSYLRENNCTHAEAMSNHGYAENDRYIQSLEAKKMDIESKMVDTVEVATALHDQVPMADSDCKLRVIDNKNGTITIERSWKNGGKSEYSHDEKIRQSETTFYRNALEKKDSITMGQNSNSVYAHQFSFQYRGLGFKREYSFGTEGVKLKNSAEGGFLNFNASIGYKRGTEGKMSTLSADASGSLAQFKETASFVVKDREYAKFSADVSALKASASAKMDSSGVAKVSASSHIVGGEVSASLSGVTITKVSGTLGEAKASASNDFFDMKASASIGDYKTSVSNWDTFKTPDTDKDEESEKHLIVGKVETALGNETALVSEKYKTTEGEWKVSNVVEQVKKDATTFVDGLKTGHIDINTDTVKGIVKDVEAIHGIKDKGFGVDVSKKQEEVVIGNGKLMEESTGKEPLSEGDVKTAKKPESVDNYAISQGNNEFGARGTCGETSVSNILNLITGRNDCTESTVLNYAVENGLCDLNSDPNLMGGTTTKDIVSLVDGMKNPEDNIHTEVYEYDKALNVDELANRLSEPGTCAIVGVDSAVLWEQNTELSGSGYGANEIPSDHWITVESPKYDENGKLLGFNIVDSGGGETFVDRDGFEKMYLGDENRGIEDPTAIIVTNNGDAINSYETSAPEESKQSYKGAMNDINAPPTEVSEHKYLQSEIEKEFGSDISQEYIDANTEKYDRYFELKDVGMSPSEIRETMLRDFLDKYKAEHSTYANPVETTPEKLSMAMDIAYKNTCKYDSLLSKEQYLDIKNGLIPYNPEKQFSNAYSKWQETFEGKTVGSIVSECIHQRITGEGMSPENLGYKWNAWGNPVSHNPGGENYVMAFADSKDVFENSSSLKEVADKLGLPEKNLTDNWLDGAQSSTIWLGKIDISDIQNLRVPVGEDSQANEFWAPGMQTVDLNGGEAKFEAVIDRIEDYSSSDVEFFKKSF
nr:hypothetical protein [uncultured Agathobacter sp.]